MDHNELTVVDAEVVAPIERADAERLDKRIRLLVESIDNNLTKLYELVEQAKAGEIHKALNYPSWTSYVADVFTVQVRLDRGQRRELVGYLSGEGMSQRVIADVVGVSKNTVTTDLQVSQIGTGEDHHPAFTDAAQEADARAMADVPEDQFEDVLVEARAQGDLSRENVVSLCSERAKITGRDGKQYSVNPTRPRERSKPRRGPIIDEFRSEILKWHPRLGRLTKLANDDRVARNRESLAGYRNDLIRFRRALDEAIDQLGGDGDD